MLKIQKCVHEMMQKLDLPLPNEGKCPDFRNIKFVLLRNLVKEESEEFDNAMYMLHTLKVKTAFWRTDLSYAMARKVKTEEKETYIASLENMTVEEFEKEAMLFWWSEVLDAICDILVVVMNTANAMGIDIEPFFDEVHRTNMEKADGPVRADGKRLKPPEWKPPRIRQLLEQLLGVCGYEYE